jgi:hypothetical protein
MTLFTQLVDGLAIGYTLDKVSWTVKQFNNLRAKLYTYQSTLQ